GPALRARVPRSRVAAADLRRRAGGRQAPDDGLHERRAGEDARLSPGGYRTVRAGSGEGNLETLRETRNAEVGTRNSAATFCSAFRVPRSAFIVIGVMLPATMTAQTWPVHSMDRPRPPVVDPGPERPPAPPPSDAIVLFDGKDLSQWQSQDGSSAKWVVRDGYVEVAPGTGAIATRRGFGSMQLHIEWATPTPPVGEGQERGNSGVFLMTHYEIQVLDSYRNETYADGQAGAVYGQTPPLANASRPPGQWQTYDIIFHRPRFAPDGSVRDSARVTVLHNGVLVQNNPVITGWTVHGRRAHYEPHPDRLPLARRDAGDLDPPRLHPRPSRRRGVSARRQPVPRRDSRLPGGRRVLRDRDPAPAPPARDFPAGRNGRRGVERPRDRDRGPPAVR